MDLKPVPTIEMGAHSYCRINCEKLVEGWQQSHSSILLCEFETKQ